LQALAGCWLKLAFFSFFCLLKRGKGLRIVSFGGGFWNAPRAEQWGNRRVSHESFPLFLESNQLALKNLGH
jgi:hypothetical protein